MTKFYEALEQFDHEQVGLEKSRETERLTTIPQVSKNADPLSPELTETLIGLYRTIFTVVPGPGGRVVQFVEAGKEGGCSKIIRAFANVSSRVLRKSVLLLDSDPQLPSNFDFFNQQSRVDWINDFKNNRGNNSSESMQDEDLLSVCRLSMESGLLPVDMESAQNEEFMENLKQTFDITLVDSWSVSVPPQPRLFSPHVDGVVLVIDAGKTRWQIAEKLKREITNQGGNVLGVILNNRTYPIPDSIYDRL